MLRKGGYSDQKWVFGKCRMSVVGFSASEAGEAAGLPASIPANLALALKSFHISPC